MTLTPDRSPGELQEDEGILLGGSTDPTVAGGMRYVSGAFRFKDGTAVFDPRTYVHGHGTTHNKGGSDALIVQNLSSGTAPSAKTFQTDGAGGINLIDYVEAFPPNLQVGSYSVPLATSSATYVHYYTFTTAVLPIGSYFLAVQSYLDSSKTGNVVDARAQIDDTTTFARCVMPVDYVGGIIPLVGVYTVAFATATTHFIDFEICKVAGAGTVTMTSAYVTMWRVS